MVCVCSQEELTDNQELVQTYRLHIAQDINQDNLGLFCATYNGYASMGAEWASSTLGVSSELSDGWTHS